MYRNDMKSLWTNKLALDKYDIQMRSISTWKWGNVVPWWWKSRTSQLLGQGEWEGRKEERYGRRGNGKSSWSSPSRAPGRRETTTKSTFGGAAATAAAAACNLSPNYFAGKSYFAAGFRNSGEDIARKSGNFKWVGVALLPCTSRIS